MSAHKQPNAKDLKRVTQYLGQARVHLTQHAFAAAEPLIKKAAAIVPNEATIQCVLGQCLLKQNKVDPALKAFKRTLELDPNDTAALQELGQIYTKRNKFELAKPLIQKAINLDPKNPTPYGMLAMVLQKQGHLLDAITPYRQAIQLRLEQSDKYPTKNIKQPPKEDFNKPELEQLLWDTLHHLAAAGIHAFASYGTLLGIVREGGLLPFDKDIDIALPLSEMPQAKRALERNGWVETFNMFLDSPMCFYHVGQEVTLDLTGHFVDTQTDQTHEGVLKDTIPFEQLRITKLPPIELIRSYSPDGQRIWALKEPEKTLEAYYGSDWRVPNSNFDTIICAKNLCGFTAMTQCYAYMRIYNTWQQGRIARAKALTAATLEHRPDDALMQDLFKVLDAIDLNKFEEADFGAETTLDAE